MNAPPRTRIVATIIFDVTTEDDEELDTVFERFHAHMGTTLAALGHDDAQVTCAWLDAPSGALKGE